MIIELGETATYGFSKPVEGLVLDLRMKALALPKQIALWSSIQTRPVAEKSSEKVDWFGNEVTTLVFERALSRLVVSGFNRLRYLDTAARATDTEVPADREPYAQTPSATRYADATFRLGDLDDLVGDLQSGWQFDPAVTHLKRPLAEIEQSRRGVCQDMCRLAVERLRQYGVPARFVVGYRIAEVQRGSLLRHAWIAARIAGEWVEVDIAHPSNDIRPLLATAWGSDLSSIGPVIGRGAVSDGTTLRVVAQGVVREAAV